MSEREKYIPKGYEEFVRALEQAFEKYRIYGDERDIKSFKAEKHEIATLPCMIQVNSFMLDGDIFKLCDPNNYAIICHENVKGLIKKFKEYRKTHKEIPYDIIRGCKPEDLVDNIDEVLKKYGELRIRSKKETEELKRNTQQLHKGVFNVGDLVKVEFTSKINDKEYMWVGIIEKKNKTTYIGILRSNPFLTYETPLKLDDVVEIKSWNIVDIYYDD